MKLSTQSINKDANANMGLLAHEKAPRDSPSFSKGNYEINLVSTVIICLPPLLALAAWCVGVPMEWYTFFAFVACYVFNGLGITMGYHRLFSHRSFTAAFPLQAILAFAGAEAFQGSIKWWGRNHRIHHRYVDTDKDPYNALRGFLYSHMGWMLMKQDYGILGRVDVRDFTNNPLIMFQHNFYLPLALCSGVLLPTAICGLGWGDWSGGFFYAAMLKVVFIHHSTFMINSLAHTSLFGAKRNYSENHSSHDSFVCAIVTLGEGYHNFHHEFSQDYRNGVKWYHYDPTKWLIRFCEMIGLASHLQRTPNQVIERNLLMTKKKVYTRLLESTDKRLSNMACPIQFPNCWTWEEVSERVKQGRKLIIVGNYVLDLEKSIPTGGGYTHRSSSIVWFDEHPGGSVILSQYLGKDATEAFSGGVYGHSEAARNLIPDLCVATLN